MASSPITPGRQAGGERDLLHEMLDEFGDVLPAFDHEGTLSGTTLRR